MGSGLPADFNPLTGQSPGGHGDGLETFAVEEREDGIYVAVEEEAGLPSPIPIPSCPKN